MYARNPYIAIEHAACMLGNEKPGASIAASDGKGRPRATTIFIKYENVRLPNIETARPAIYAERWCRISTIAILMPRMVMIRASPRFVNQVKNVVSKGVR